MNQLHEDNNLSSRRKFSIFAKEVLAFGGVWRITNFFGLLFSFSLALLVHVKRRKGREGEEEERKRRKARFEAFKTIQVRKKIKS